MFKRAIRKAGVYIYVGILPTENYYSGEAGRNTKFKVVVLQDRYYGDVPRDVLVEKFGANYLIVVGPFRTPLGAQYFMDHPENIVRSVDDIEDAAYTELVNVASARIAQDWEHNKGIVFKSKREIDGLIKDLLADVDERGFVSCARADATHYTVVDLRCRKGAGHTIDVAKTEADLDRVIFGPKNPFIKILLRRKNGSQEGS